MTDETMNSTTQRVLRVALLGCGTVGAKVAHTLLTQGDDLAAKSGCALELVGVAVRDASLSRPGIPDEMLTEDPAALVADSGADIVIELIGGIDPPRQLILSAIEHGASVVTANKALLAKHGEEIYAAAERKGVDIYYEAAVAGAIPIVRPLRESLVGDQILAVMGIVNGTTNYILDKMTTEHQDFAAALATAQKLGFAEADPTADIEGFDAASKAAILASLAYHSAVRIDDVYREGITGVTSEDIRAAELADCVVKLLAVARLDDQGRIEVRVHPVMVPRGHPLAMVQGANNAIFIEAANAGRLMFMGPGAGGSPTASAVTGDLVTVARNRLRGVENPAHSVYRGLEVAPMRQTRTRYHLRFQVADQPGVLAAVAGLLAQHRVSIHSVHQHAERLDDRPDLAVLSMVTHMAREADVMACITELEQAGYIHGQVRFMRVEGV